MLKEHTLFEKILAIIIAVSLVTLFVTDWQPALIVADFLLIVGILGHMISKTSRFWKYANLNLRAIWVACIVLLIAFVGIYLSVAAEEDQYWLVGGFICAVVFTVSTNRFCRKYAADNSVSRQDPKYY